VTRRSAVHVGNREKPAATRRSAVQAGSFRAQKKLSLSFAVFFYSFSSCAEGYHYVKFDHSEASTKSRRWVIRADSILTRGHRLSAFKFSWKAACHIYMSPESKQSASGGIFTRRRSFWIKCSEGEVGERAPLLWTESLRPWDQRCCHNAIMVISVGGMFLCWIPNT